MLKVDTARMEAQITQLNEIAKQLDGIASRVSSVNRKLGWRSSVDANVRLRLLGYSQGVSGLSNKSAALSGALNTVMGQYIRAEEKAKTTLPSNETAGVPSDSDTDMSVWDKFKYELFENYGWEELLAGAGYFSSIYDLINEIRSGKTWGDFAKAGANIYQFFTGAAKTFQNYLKIGNAVGTKTAMAWWVKNITGIKPLGRASTAKNFFTRFSNNLSNKTSPFYAQFKDVVDNFKGTNGVGKAIASWGAVAVNGVVNAFSNIDEQRASNGTMSTGRVIAETITETAIDTALTYGAGIVVGAAVTTVIGTAAAPGVVVVALSGLTIAAVNAGVKAITDKSLTEWASDSILNTGEKIGTAIKNATGSVGKWFKQLAFI